MLFDPALGLCPGLYPGCCSLSFSPECNSIQTPYFCGTLAYKSWAKRLGPSSTESLSLTLSLFVTHQFSGRTNFLLHKIHAVPALGWTIICSEYKLFGPILSYSDVRSSCSSVHSPIHCLPLLKKEVLQEEMNCMPKPWACTLLCSTDPDPGAHGKCLVLGEVYLTPVCWTVNSLG